MKKSLSRFAPLLAALAAAVVASILFRATFAPGIALASPDSQPFRFTGWLDGALLNLLGGRFEMLTFETPLYWLFPLDVASDLSYILASALTALAAALYLRHWRCPPAAAVLGGLSLAFSGYLFSLFNAGHRGFFLLMPYTLFLLRAIDGMVETGRWPYFVFGAVCAVSALRPQPDMFMLFSIVLGAYALLRAIAQMRVLDAPARLCLAKRWIAGICVLVATTVLFGAHAIQHVLTDVVGLRESQIAQAAQRETAKEKTSADGEETESGKRETPEDTTRWDFTTSWSLPPAELPELVCPNLRGFDTGNPAGPYWGSIGRDVHYAETKQGFFNFRQHTIYLGATTCLLALVAALAAVTKTRKSQVPGPKSQVPGPKSQVPGPESHVDATGNGIRAAAPQGPRDSRSGPTGATGNADNRLVVVFWSVVAVVGLVLALGRYTPVYRLFYRLPMMSSLRGPLKFLHLTEVAVSLLAGFGCSRLLAEDGSKTRRRALAAAGFAGLATALALLGASLISPKGLVTALPAMGVPESSVETFRTLLDGLRVKTLLLTALVFALGSVALLVSAFRNKAPAWLGWALAVLVALDMGRASAPYVNPLDTRTLSLPNALVESLRKSGQLDASAWAGQAGGLEQHPAFVQLFDHYQFLHADPKRTDTPDGLVVQSAIHIPTDTLRRWQLLGTRIAIVPMDQYNAMPKESAEFLKLGTYAFTQRGIVALSGPSAQFGVLVLRNWIPNGSVFTRWETAENTDAAWERLASPSLDLARTLVLTGTDAPASPSSTGVAPLAAKSKTVVGEDEGHWRRIVFETSDTSPAGLLFFRNRFMGFTELVATVDNNPVPIHTADIFFHAVSVPAGKHTVEIRVPMHTSIAIAYAATLLLVLAGAWALGKSK